MNIVKLCKRCGEAKELSAFYCRIFKGKKYTRGICKRCVDLVAKKWINENPEKHKTTTKKLRQGEKWLNNYYKYNYGIEKKEYDYLLHKQNGKCAICGDVNKNGNALAVDHDHKTGKIRGLLCFRCNVILGQCKESKEILLAMVNYI